MPFGLPQETIELMKGLFTQYPKITGVKIYGSRARGNYQKGSDIDLAIYQEGKDDLSGKLLGELDEFPYLFDVVAYRGITHLPLKEEIDEEGLWFYQRSESVF